ncbi:CGNR zinc finger domain-containing protein [Streptomyces sp. SP18CS02]|uniref:CGNR zinc finger domain-containing protein n=1 Tax=Streptomyces sp. SP18CS02 TaxID=3002531 RepID=UPI002E7760EC|nr:CGNR zinc finger domain-containing protein [Streptomyces sp. SP18CS02]MEE1752239.1 CGNR zinc finger domain-containing protein [Streptomyces sp. SP18CS02]
MAADRSTGSGGRRFDSGRLCLDLMATGEPSSPDRLSGPEALTAWLVAAGLVPAGTPLPAVDAHWVARFGELRRWTGQLVRAQLDGRGGYADCALARLNTLAAAAPPAPRAVRATAGEGNDLVRALGSTPDCGALLAAVARDAIDLLTDPAARARLRQCEGDDCARVYLDTSRGRRRRWCSSELCGNRERVARHRARIRKDLSKKSPAL